MNSIDRRGFLKTTAAWGLAPIPTLRSGPAGLSDDDALGVRKEFAVTQDQTYLNSAYVGPMPNVVYEAAVRYADEQRLTPAIGLDTKRVSARSPGSFGARPPARRVPLRRRHPGARYVSHESPPGGSGFRLRQLLQVAVLQLGRRPVLRAGGASGANPTRPIRPQPGGRVPPRFPLPPRVHGEEVRILRADLRRRRAARGRARLLG